MFLVTLRRSSWKSARSVFSHNARRSCFRFWRSFSRYMINISCRRLNSLKTSVFTANKKHIRESSFSPYMLNCPGVPFRLPLRFFPDVSALFFVFGRSAGLPRNISILFRSVPRSYTQQNDNIKRPPLPGLSVSI